jgi:hypothetical protein
LFSVWYCCYVAIKPISGGHNFCRLVTFISLGPNPNTNKSNWVANWRKAPYLSKEQCQISKLSDSTFFQNLIVGSVTESKSQSKIYLQAFLMLGKLVLEYTFRDCNARSTPGTGNLYLSWVTGFKFATESRRSDHYNHNMVLSKFFYTFTCYMNGFKCQKESYTLFVQISNFIKVESISP